MADLRVAVEPSGDGRPMQRIYLDGHEISGVRRVRVYSEWGCQTASLDLDLDAVSIDPRAVSRIGVVCGADNADLTVEAGNVNSPVAASMMPGWARGPARAYHPPDAFDRARHLCTRLVDADWLFVIGMT